MTGKILKQVVRSVYHPNTLQSPPSVFILVYFLYVHFWKIVSIALDHSDVNQKTVHSEFLNSSNPACYSNISLLLPYERSSPLLFNGLMKKLKKKHCTLTTQDILLGHFGIVSFCSSLNRIHWLLFCRKEIVKRELHSNHNVNQEKVWNRSLWLLRRYFKKH